MYYEISAGSWRRLSAEKPTGEIFGLFSYEEMDAVAQRWGLSAEALAQARRFGYAQYDSYENFDCISLEMLDFENILLSLGSVVLYLERGRVFFFTAKAAQVQEILESCMEEGGERISPGRVVYAFFEKQTKGDALLFDALEREILQLEEAVLAAKKRNCVAEIISLRKRLLVLKKYYAQFLMLLDILLANENAIFPEQVLLSFRMLQRRTERRFQQVLHLRESVTQLRESYEAEVDISLNTTMQIFTVVTTIFLPLTVLAGWYGMNFQMPEYGWRHGYAFVSLLSLGSVLFSIAFFKNKKWF